VIFFSFYDFLKFSKASVLKKCRMSHDRETYDIWGGLGFGGKANGNLSARTAAAVIHRFNGSFLALTRFADLIN